jgi:PBP1b-binding outer membrane lipoprotein LpoB
MKKNKSIISIFLTLLFLNACSSVAEGLGATKKKGSDEFLVEKKAPLVVPPSFGKLPSPGKIDKDIDSIKEKNLSIEEIISKDSSTRTKNDKSNNSIEKSIIEKINEK